MKDMMLIRSFKPALFGRLIIITLLSWTTVTFAADPSDTTPAETAETTSIAGYIKDDLFIYMHAGPGTRFKILGSITAGTPAEQLEIDQESDYIKIKDSRGRIGWIEQSSYTTEATKQVILEQLQQQYDQIIQSNQSNESSMDDLTIKLQAAEQAHLDSNERITTLKRQNEQLQAQIAVVSNDKVYQKMLYGAGICICSICFGLILPGVLRRRRRADNWV